MMGDFNGTVDNDMDRSLSLKKEKEQWQITRLIFSTNREGRPYRHMEKKD